MVLVADVSGTNKQPELATALEMSISVIFANMY
jgi:hypothetical protein